MQRNTSRTNPTSPRVQWAPKNPYIQPSDEILRVTPEKEIFDDPICWEQSLGEIDDLPLITNPPMPIDKQRNRMELEHSSNRQKKRDKQIKKQKVSGVRTGIDIFLILFSLCATGFMIIALMPQLTGYFWADFGNYAFINGRLVRYDPTNVAHYKQNRTYLNRDVIYPGIFIDGEHVGEMTRQEVREMLEKKPAPGTDAFSVTVAIGDKTWKLDPGNVETSHDNGDVIEHAYAIGRSFERDTMEGETPFEARTRQILHLREEGINLTTGFTYDREAVRKKVKEINDYVTRDPIDAQIQSFDYNTRTFTFTQSQPGVTIDQDDLYDKIIAAIDRGENGAVVTTSPVIREPAVTTEMLNSQFKMVAAYTTKTTSDSKRNTNIRLACEAVNGTALMPGETFSFNKATGERTTAKGYKSAGAISSGQSIEEVGGGICQVSSTIFNAVARANLEIVSRSPHAWPSNYVNMGEDATVNWPNLDFKFKNNTQAPIFLIAYYKDRQCSAEIWGMTLGEGITIDLESTVKKHTKAPSEVKYVYNPELDYGSSETTVKARDGYEVETYKVWLKDGTEIKRELLCKSTYKPYQQVVEYNE